VRRLVASALELRDLRGATLGCVIHLRDVTERMLIKEQMWRMEQFASLSTLASGLLHEIKNPLTALSIHVQLLEERLENDAIDQQTAELIGVLKTEVHRLNNTLSSFRDFAKLERLSLKAIDVQEVLQDVARLISPQARQQGVQLEFLRAGQGLPRVELDPGKIEQAVLNLVLNALEAMPEGGELTLGTEADWRQRPHCRARQRARHPARDSGPYLPPLLFDQGKRHRHGSGSGGEAGSPAPRPTRFSDQSSRHDVLDHTAGARAERRRRRVMSNEVFPILIVDDEPNIRTGLARALECESYAIATAGDAGEALRQFRITHHPLVLTDLKMPGASTGIDLIRSIKDERPETLIIVITAHGTVETAVEAMRLGARAYAPLFQGLRTTFSCVFEGFSRELSSHYMININCNALYSPIHYRKVANM
jgi:CheY-like chemotaxis protein